MGSVPAPSPATAPEPLSCNWINICIQFYGKKHFNLFTPIESHSILILLIQIQTLLRHQRELLSERLDVASGAEWLAVLFVELGKKWNCIVFCPLKIFQLGKGIANRLLCFKKLFPSDQDQDKSTTTWCNQIARKPITATALAEWRSRVFDFDYLKWNKFIFQRIKTYLAKRCCRKFYSPISSLELYKFLFNFAFQSPTKPMAFGEASFKCIPTRPAVIMKMNFCRLCIFPVRVAISCSNFCLSKVPTELIFRHSLWRA